MRKGERERERERIKNKLKTIEVAIITSIRTYQKKKKTSIRKNYCSKCLIFYFLRKET